MSNETTTKEFTSQVDAIVDAANTGTTFMLIVTGVSAVRNIEIPQEGVKLSEWTGYDRSLSYIKNGQTRMQLDDVIKPGDTVVGVREHRNS